MPPSRKRAVAADAPSTADKDDAGISDTWLQELRKHADSESKSVLKAELTTAPVDLRIVSSASRAMGVHFQDNWVNESTKTAIKALRSPTDNYTYVFNWHAKSQLWAHMKTIEHRSFCTLGALLNSEEFIKLWNDESLVKSIKFYRDRYDGPEITEQEAVELNSQYRPSLPAPSSPHTSSSSSQRRRFQ